MICSVLQVQVPPEAAYFFTKKLSTDIVALPCLVSLAEVPCIRESERPGKFACTRMYMYMYMHMYTYICLCVMYNVYMHACYPVHQGRDTLCLA